MFDVWYFWHVDLSSITEQLQQEDEHIDEVEIKSQSAMDRFFLRRCVVIRDHIH